MTQAQRERARRECRDYCLACTDAQLGNVYRDERARGKPKRGDVAATARIFADEARKELVRRGLVPA